MKSCIKCTKFYYPKKPTQKLCSRPCQISYAHSMSIKSKKGRLRSGKIIVCKVCKKEFYVRPYRAVLSKTKYCSRSCLAKEKLNNFRPIYGFQRTNKPYHKYKTIRVDGKQVRLHRWIMEQHLARKLEHWEHVHHINDDSSDNRLENLEVLSNADHQRKEIKFRKKITSSS